MKPCYTLSVPSEVMDAAKLVENYFKEQGVETWELGGICSRNIALRSHRAADEIISQTKWAEHFQAQSHDRIRMICEAVKGGKPLPFDTVKGW